MPDKEIIQNRIRSLGHSQKQRTSELLKSDFVQLDERNTQDYLGLLTKMAKHVNFFNIKDKADEPSQNWSGFFPIQEADIDLLIQSIDQDASPHLGLLLAFLRMYQEPQGLINHLTQRHLDFHYQDVLQMHKLAAVPDRAHVAITLKKLVEPQLITPEMMLYAGTDEEKRERLYKPVRETVINRAEITSLRSLYQDDLGVLRYAPVADSFDGLGPKPNDPTFSWYGFGHDELPAADVGFAVAAPVLRMAEGIRTVTLKITFSSSGSLNSSALQQAFKIYLTGEKSWLGPYVVTPELEADSLNFTFSIGEDEDAIVDFDSKLHPGSFSTIAPLLQVLLNKENDTAYDLFKDIQLTSIEIDVDIRNIRSLDLANDLGKLNSAKKFLPFGGEPKIGSKFVVASQEAFTKRLSKVDLVIDWTDTYEDLGEHYSNYGVSNLNNRSFTASVSFEDGAGWQASDSSFELFDENDARESKTLTFDKDAINIAYRPNSALIFMLVLANNTWSTNVMRQLIFASPTQSSVTSTPPIVKSGEMIFSLNRDFLHSTYRKKYVENVVKFSKTKRKLDPVLTILAEPLVPAVSQISLNYKATSGVVDLTDNSIKAYADDNVVFFHVGYFGQMREHRYMREQLDFIDSKPVTLFHEMNSKGELLIGLKELNAGDSIPLLFQVAEGSADPDLLGESITWSALCDNYWKPLKNSEVVFDSTNQLLKSGLFQLLIPNQVTTTNTLLPNGLLWLKASINQNVTAVCKFIDVIANVVEVEYQLPAGAQPEHLRTNMPAGSIVKFRDAIANVKSVNQTYASVGGSLSESNNQFNTRVSERLRHKDRCITPWDYARLVLGHFPNISKAKCIPHSKPGSWAAPGNIMMVLVPDLTNQNAIDSLQPRVDSDTIDQVKQLLLERVGGQTSVHVSNPRYQSVQVTLKVRFHTGFEYNYHQGQLDLFIQKTLSPWAFNTDSVIEVEFGGKLYDSILLKAIENLDYVDYVIDFGLLSDVDGVMTLNKQGMISAQEPDVILVSSTEHIIEEASA